MEFGLREALLGLGVIVIVLIIIDGFRRKLMAARAAREESIGAGGNADGEWDLFKGELSGGARSVKRSDAEDRVEPGFGSASGTADADQAISATVDEHAAPAGDAVVDFSLGAADAVANRDSDDAVAVEEPAQEESRRVDFEDVIVINVVARPRDEILGNDLLRALLSVGLRYGSMDIFHRHEQITGKGSVLFSAVNLLEPGTFDLNRMEDFRTPGICLFMRLPGPKRSLFAFEQLIESSRKIANMLGAELKDEHHSVLTGQTVEHYRQRVLDFERKMLSHRATQR